MAITTVTFGGPATSTKFNEVITDVNAANAAIAGYSTWTTYSPTCTFNSSATNVVSTGRWSQVGTMVDCIIQFRCTGAVGAGGFAANLPFSVNAADTTLSTVAHDIVIGDVSLLDSGSTWNSICRAYVTNGTRSVVQVDVAASGTRDNMRQAAPFTWASGDGGILTLRYRV